jgi:TIR domain-containing protein
MSHSQHAFVSYSQPDRECAHAIVAHLEAQGVQCWIAPRDISPSSDWAEEIIDAITAARVMILVFSSSSNHSPQVRREVERAVHKQVSILPFRIEDVIPSKSLEFFLSSQHWLDAFPPPLEPHYQRLCSHLKAQAAQSPAAAAAPPVSKALPPVEAHGAAATLTAPVLAQIECLLAGYIGPLAKHLVKRAAARATGRADLIARLAAELDAESDRCAFAQRCKQLPSA